MFSIRGSKKKSELGNLLMLVLICSHSDNTLKCLREHRITKIQNRTRAQGQRMHQEELIKDEDTRLRQR